MSFFITGATGFIGQALTRKLLKNENEVVVLSRNENKARKIFGESVGVCEWDGVNAGDWRDYLDGKDAVINLAGENIGKKYWTQSVKKTIMDSRVFVGKALVQAIGETENKPKVFIQASAVGYYGSRSNEELKEDSEPGTGFLAEVTRAWEDSTKEVESMGIRRVITRNGVVLGKESLILARMEKPFKLFVGGAPGSGKQQVSWIHLNDLLSGISFLLSKEHLSGAFNLTSPEPVPMSDFCKALANSLNRPMWLPVPEFIIRTVFGEMGRDTILTSQRVLPERLLQSNFSFSYPSITPALDSIYERDK